MQVGTLGHHIHLVRFFDPILFLATLESNVRNIKANVFDLRIHTTRQNHFALVMRWNFGGISDFQAG